MAGSCSSSTRRTLRPCARGDSLVLGLLWACWHLPLFFVPGLSNHGQSFPLFVVARGSRGRSPWHGSMRIHDGSLLLAMLMHSAVDQIRGHCPTRLVNPGNPFALDTSLRDVALWCDFVDDGRILPRPDAARGADRTFAQATRRGAREGARATRQRGSDWRTLGSAALAQRPFRTRRADGRVCAPMENARNEGVGPQSALECTEKILQCS